MTFARLVWTNYPAKEQSLSEGGFQFGLQFIDVRGSFFETLTRYVEEHLQNPQ
jgi:hypothetical protein